jgi:heme exporter protein B
MKRFLGLVVRDVRLALKAGSDATVAIMFFILAATLFPLGVGPDAVLLGRIAAGVVWVAALLASLLALERMFANDHEDGTLDLLALSPLPLEAVAAAKALAHWLVTGLPLIAAAPLAALMLALPAEGYATLALSLLLGTPSLSLLGTAGAALTVGARRGGVLVSLLVLPIFVPVLIFAVGAIEAALTGQPPRPHLLLLSGVLALALPLGPIAAAAALRQALE